MWSFANLARPGQFGRPGHPYPYPPPHFNRANGDEGHGKRVVMMNAAVYKGTAVVTAGVVGAISAYKGLPEVKGTMGLLSFDVIAGVLLGGLEFYMLWKGHGGKKVAAASGVSTGLLCHWAAVQGTIWGAGKAKAETLPASTTAKGVDYNAHDGSAAARSLPDARRNVASTPAAGQPAAAGRGFQPYYGMY